jgi:hypothetical protein
VLESFNNFTNQIRVLTVMLHLILLFF